MQLTSYLKSLRPPDIHFARCAAAAAAAVQLWSLGREMYQTGKAFDAGAEILIDPAFMWARLGIAASLLISAACLWFRKASAFYVSVSALAWVLVEFVRWYFWTRQVIEAAGIEQWPAAAPQAFGMGGASGYDAAVLLLTAALFLWHVKTFFAAAAKRGTTSAV